MSDKIEAANGTVVTGRNQFGRVKLVECQAVDRADVGLKSKHRIGMNYYGGNLNFEYSGNLGCDSPSSTFLVFSSGRVFQ